MTVGKLPKQFYIYLREMIKLSKLFCKQLRQLENFLNGSTYI